MRMRGRELVCLALLSWTGICTCDAADDDDGFLSAVMEFTGCTDAGEVDGDEVGRLSEYYEHPLMLNYASRSRLLSSGLLSAYQVAVLADYRERTGDILSFEELAILDGFGRDFVSGLKYFVSLESHSLPGIPSSRPAAVRNTATFRSGVRTGEDRYGPEGTYSMKYSVRAGERFEAGISMRSAYQESHFPPEKISFHAALYGRRRPWKILAGDFRLRFGQGLALWPGFSMSGVSTPDAFARKPSGISPYNSYSGEGAFRGIAADFSLKHFTVSAFVSGLGLRDLAEGGKEISPDLLYGLNAGWYGMSGQMSITCFAVTPLVLPEIPSGTGLKEYFPTAMFSVDTRFSFRGTGLFSEVACDMVSGSIAALAGAVLPVSDGVRAAMMLRYYPPGYSAEYSGAVRSGSRCSNEYGASMALSHSCGRWMDIAGKTGFGSSERRYSGSFSADACYSPEPKYGTDTSSFQVKVVVSEDIRISPYFSLGLRFSGRYRSYGEPVRADVRTDFRTSFGNWKWNLRLNLLHCAGTSALSYLETGYGTGGFSAWLRAGIFRVDDWDDRIYVYERDAPGNFSVPAYYGRGYWTALTAGWKFARGLKLYFRGSFQDYPWLRPSETTKKPARTELKFQLSVDLFSLRRDSGPRSGKTSGPMACRGSP